MKRLLYIINDANFFNTSRLPIAIKASEADYDVHVATAGGDAANLIIRAGLKHHTLPISRGGKNPFKELILFVKILKLVGRLKPELVHCISIKPILYGGIAARIHRIPALVLAVSGLGSLFLEVGFLANLRQHIAIFLYKVAFRHKNMIGIFQNSSDQKALCDLGITTANNSVLLNGSGIDLERFSVSKEPECTLKILFVARLLKDKGILEFVDAAKICWLKRPELNFLVAGDIDLENPSSIKVKDRDQIAKLPNVKLLGNCSCMEKIYSQANIIVLPSYSEGFPRVLCEAAASQRAVITTDVPGCRDAIIPNETGLLVPVKSTVELADAIIKLSEKSELRQKFAIKGRSHAEKLFDINVIVQQHLNIYEELVRKSS